MHAHLAHFIDQRCVVAPEARIPLVEFLRHFRASVPSKARGSWGRGRVIVELTEAGFIIGLDDDRRTHVGGLCIRGHWAEHGGKLTLEPRNARP